MLKRRHPSEETTPKRRSTNACQRCKDKKIKCHFGPGLQQRTCQPCEKSNSDCVFEVNHDGVPKGAAYINELERRLAEYEQREGLGDARLNSPAHAHSEGRNGHSHGRKSSISGTALQPDSTTFAPSGFHERLNENGGLGTPTTGPRDPKVDLDMLQNMWSKKHEILAASAKKVSIYNFARPPPDLSALDGPAVDGPWPLKRARKLIEKTYLYTQARYCIVDWANVLRWQDRKEEYLHAHPDRDVETQTGAFFLYMMYAIGSQLVENPDVSPEEYFECARVYLPVILVQQDLVTVQALLTLVQYYYRAPDGPPVWQLVGSVMRLCVELGLHRKLDQHEIIPQSNPYGGSNYHAELRKRFFWCAYCLDRSVSILSKRPFSIQDADIDIELPVDIDVTCMDEVKIRDLQIKQANGAPYARNGPETSITAALHHVQMYAIRSRILTKFSGPHAVAPSDDAIMHFLSELEAWKYSAPSEANSQNLPRQSSERIKANYYYAALLLIRPLLGRSNISLDILQRCANLCADGCENERTLCLSVTNHNSPITIYNCFRGGVTFLQCLVRHPQAVPLTRACRAINACSSALAVYTRTIGAAQTFLELFEKLSDRMLNQIEPSSMPQDLSFLRDLLQRATSCPPTQIPDLLKSMSEEAEAQDFQAPSYGIETERQYDFLLATDPISTLHLEPMMPYMAWPNVEPTENVLSQQAMPMLWNHPLRF